jgi:hypothetical protein
LTLIIVKVLSSETFYAEFYSNLTISIHAQNSPQGSKTVLSSKPNLTTVQTGATTQFSSYFTNFNPDDRAENANYPVPGWPSLARFISQTPDLEAFPSFSDLAIKSLLYYQAELASLRKELNKAE